MKCSECSLEARVLETRQYSKTDYITKRRYVCPRGHRFNSFEIPEETFNDQKARLLARTLQFAGAVERRVKSAAISTQIDRLLEEGMTKQNIAVVVGCSMSRVEKRSQERKMQI